MTAQAHPQTTASVRSRQELLLCLRPSAKNPTTEQLIEACECHMNLEIRSCKCQFRTDFERTNQRMSYLLRSIRLYVEDGYLDL